MKKILQNLEEQLHKRSYQHLLRSLPSEVAAVDFASNDYLGLARNNALADCIEKAAMEHTGSLHGATGSRLISGNSALAEALETELAEFFLAEACLLYNSGYAANQGLMSALLQRGDTVLYDELAHACIKDGCRLSAASRYSFRHNDSAHLRQKLARSVGNKYVVVESVYSMDGDEAPLAELLAVCKEYDAGLIVDEAHSTALWGPNGAGSCVAQGVAADVLARVHTFGKGLGVHGACVAGASVLLQYLINFSRPFIYTTALPAHALLAIREALRYRAAHPELVQQLFRNIGLFHHYLKESGTGFQDKLVSGRGPIQALLIPGNHKVVAAAKQLQAMGLLVWPILAPTVPAGEERLRICLHAFNTEEEIKQLTEALYSLLT